MCLSLPMFSSSHRNPVSSTPRLGCSPFENTCTYTLNISPRTLSLSSQLPSQQLRPTLRPLCHRTPIGSCHLPYNTPILPTPLRHHIHRVDNGSQVQSIVGHEIKRHSTTSQSTILLLRQERQWKAIGRCHLCTCQRGQPKCVSGAEKLIKQSTSITLTKAEWRTTNQLGRLQSHSRRLHQLSRLRFTSEQLRMSTKVLIPGQTTSTMRSS